MTIGYPDYIRESKESGTLLDTATITAGPNVGSAIFYTGNYKYLLITLDTTASTHFWGITPIYSTNASMSPTMGQTNSGINPGLQDTIIARVRGPWCQVIFYWWDVSNTDHATYFIYGTNIEPVPFVGDAASGEWVYFNGTIAASSTQLMQPINWHSGTAYFIANCLTAGALVMSLDKYPFSVGWQNYASLAISAVANRSTFGEIPTPASPFRIRLVNTTAGAINAQILAVPRSLAAV